MDSFRWDPDARRLWLAPRLTGPVIPALGRLLGQGRAPQPGASRPGGMELAAERRVFPSDLVQLPYHLPRAHKAPQRSDVFASCLLMNPDHCPKWRPAIQEGGDIERQIDATVAHSLAEIVVPVGTVKRFGVEIEIHYVWHVFDVIG